MSNFLFIYFLDKNNYLYRPSGEKKINDNALTALSLLIAVGDQKGTEHTDGHRKIEGYSRIFEVEVNGKISTKEGNE